MLEGDLQSGQDGISWDNLSKCSYMRKNCKL
jgi:hypothetical protein